MSTTTTGARREDEIECSSDRRTFLCSLEADSFLLLPGQLRERLIGWTTLQVSRRRGALESP
jgi:hypothetical protein